MKKTLHIEISLKRYLETLRSEKFATGLLLGQNSTEKDFVVHLAKTQIRKESDDIAEIGDLKKEHVIEHIRNVIQILPGGMTVLGLFFIGDASLLNATTLRAVKSILNAVNDYQSDNQFYFFDKNLNPKYIIHYVDNTNITCKKFSSSQAGNQFDVIDLVFSSNYWNRISCYYDFENLLPLYLETVSNAILHDKFMDILKHVSQSVKESILLFNGEIKKELELIKSLGKRSNKETSQSKLHEDDDIRIIVDLYTPSALQIPSFPTKISDYVAELKCFGTLCSDVYLHDDANVSEVIKAVKEDIIRSLCSRLTMHCHSLLEDLSSSGLDEMKIIHEPPRRISVRLPYSKVRFTDYLFPGEENMSSLPAKEQLDLHDVVDETSLYEALEMETDASQFHSCENSKLDVKGLSPGKKNLTYRISAGIVLTLFLLVLAIFIQKIRSS